MTPPVTKAEPPRTREIGQGRLPRPSLFCGPPDQRSRSTEGGRKQSSTEGGHPPKTGGDNRAAGKMQFVKDTHATWLRTHPWRNSRPSLTKTSKWTPPTRALSSRARSSPSRRDRPSSTSATRWKAASISRNSRIPASSPTSRSATRSRFTCARRRTPRARPSSATKWPAARRPGTVWRKPMPMKSASKARSSAGSRAALPSIWAGPSRSCPALRSMCARCVTPARSWGSSSRSRFSRWIAAAAISWCRAAPSSRKAAPNSAPR